jgi:hypothetical protein
MSKLDSYSSRSNLFWNCPYTILQKKWWDRHKGHGSDRTPLPVWPNVIQKKKFSPTRRNIYKKQHGARPCVEKMQLIFFVPPNEELEGTLHPQKFGCTPKNEGKRVHVPPDEKTCGHSDVNIIIPSPTKLRRDIVMLPSFRNILVNTLESTSVYRFWPNLVHT